MSRAEVLISLRKHDSVRQLLRLPERIRQGSEAHTAFEQLFQEMDSNDDREVCAFPGLVMPRREGLTDAVAFARSHLKSLRLKCTAFGTDLLNHRRTKPGSKTSLYHHRKGNLKK